MNRIYSIVILLFIIGLSRVNAQSIDTIWLSSLDINKASLGWGQPGQNKSCQGNPITINGIQYASGFGTHANSSLYISLKGGSQRFSAIVGIDDEVKVSIGTVVFSIYGAGQLLWKSNIIKAGSPPEKFDINVSRIDTLLLKVDGAGDGNGWDHADWANAYFLVSGTKPVTVGRIIEEAVILTPKNPPSPQIHGPKITGVRPGHDFLFRIPATGNRPMEFSAKGLPAGLKLDEKSGIISGNENIPGRYEVELTATNKLGSCKRKLTIAVGDQIALTPPLGWNSWNCFACAVTQEKVFAAADAMINSGLADHGWNYINIDDCWMVKPDSDDPILGGKVRDEAGNMLTNKKFPDMKALADKVHSRGLKIGIYSGPGPKTCAGYEACFMHENQDAAQFAKWGIDYLKYDWCDYEKIAKDHSLPELKKPYVTMMEALGKVDRDIVYSLCQYGMGDVWEWGAEVNGNCWRTTGDITDDWSSMEEIGFNQAGHEKYAGPGHWNDPDMLVVGKVGWGPDLHPTRLSPYEQYTHISLWALLASPLLIGCDMTQLDDFTFNLLSNDEVIDINQDPLGKQASRILQLENMEIWAKPLEDGSIAVGMFNRGMFGSKIVLKWSDLGISGKRTIRDVWTQKNLGVFDTRFEASIPSHGVKLVRIYR
ncbi:MAG: NPCBM/NEW2 domain-containing protein [Bacteroidetes bacterium]|nr:NPCBM/NEW2 domain-containing protein [Bacteroidota bacterium]